MLTRELSEWKEDIHKFGALIFHLTAWNAVTIKRSFVIQSCRNCLENHPQWLEEIQFIYNSRRHHHHHCHCHCHCRCYIRPISIQDRFPIPNVGPHCIRLTYATLDIISLNFHSSAKANATQNIISSVVRQTDAYLMDINIPLCGLKIIF